MEDPGEPRMRAMEPPSAPGAPDSFSASERAFLQGVDRRVIASVSLDDIMGYLFDSARAAQYCERLCLALLEEDDQRVKVYWVRADYEPILLDREYTMDLRATSLSALIDEKKLRVIDDLEAYHQRHPSSEVTELLVREGVRSSLTCPLEVDKRVVGLMFANSRRPRGFERAQERMLSVVARRIAQAVDKTYRIEQLTAFNNAYLEMLDFVSHELKNPLSSLIMDGELLVGGYLGELPQEPRRIAERMMQKARYLLNLVREYLVLSRIEGQRLTGDFRQNVDFASEVVAPAVDLVIGELEARNMRLVLATSVAPSGLECDPYLLRIALTNLLGNAVKYGRPGGEVRLRTEQSAEGLLVSVWNEGAGFPAEARSRLFRKFSRLETPAQGRQKGTGVGLYIIWKIIQIHGGQIWAESEEDAWAEFTIEIPLPISPAAT